MGKAVALLVPFSPDWRWLLDRTDSPWYPSMRIFRQATIGDWDGPLQRVQQELADVARRPAASTGYSLRLIASGRPCLGCGAVARPDAP